MSNVSPDMTIEEFARRIRIHVLQMTSRGKSSHIGSAFSVADIVAVLYREVMNINLHEPKDPLRDRLILSKGHAGVCIYAVLAESGFFPLEHLKNYYQDGSTLSGHLSHKGVPGVELSTGSLGHGLPVAAGMAYAAQLDGAQHRVFALLSDGECDEGSNWEAILLASHLGLSNLTVIVDYNKIQSLGPVSETIALEPFRDKWISFGWAVTEVDGHSHAELARVLRRQDPEKPGVVIAHTTKGKGVSFMENSVLWHYRSAQGEEFDNALRELKST